MKPLVILGLLVVSVSLLGVASCEENVAAKYGIKIVPDPNHPGQVMAIQDPTQNKVGDVLNAASGATSSVPVAGQVVGGISLVANLLGAWLLSRAKARADATNEATNTGLQNFVNAQPKPVGDALIAHLDAAHDEADVPGHHQDAIQPVAKAVPAGA